MFTSLALSLAVAAAGPDKCDPLPGWETIAEAADGKFLILGDQHGTVEAPAALAEYVCAASDGRSLLVALELASPLDPAYRAAWNGPHEGFRGRILAIDEWAAREDGVTSTAMLDMLERLHALKSAGRQIDIAAFNGARDEAQRAQFSHLPSQEPHEASQAANIRAAATRGAYHQTIVFVGPAHAQKAINYPGQSREFRSMAMLIAARENVISLAMTHHGGESWSCQLAADAELVPGEPVTDDMIDCGAHPLGPAAADPDRQRSMAFLPDDRRDAWDGYYHLGVVTASPPARP